MFKNATLIFTEMKDKRILLIFITVFIDLVGFGIIIPMNPYLAKQFGATPFQVGWLMSIYSLMQFVFAPIWGQLSDRFGRRPIILISLLASSLAHMGFAISESFESLFFFRLFAGVGGANLPVAMAYIADITDEKDRSKGMGLIGAAFGLGFILGPALGGVFASVGENLGSTPPLGASFPAVIASAICFFNMIGAWFYLPETYSAQRKDVPVQFHGPIARLKKILLAVRDSALGRLYFIYFLTGFALSFVEIPLFLFVEKKFNWTMAEASYGFAYIGLMMVITQGYLIRKFLPRFGEKRLLPIGLILFAIGLGGCFFAETPWMMAPFVTFLAIGYGLSNPAITGSISLLSSKSTQGENLGVAQSLSALSRILGPISGGWIFQKISISAPFLYGSVAALAAFFLSITILRKLGFADKNKELG